MPSDVALHNKQLTHVEDQRKGDDYATVRCSFRNTMTAEHGFACKGCRNHRVWGVTVETDTVLSIIQHGF